MADKIRAVTVPKWGLAMTEGTVVAWYANEGDQVEAGNDLVEIETPKITNLCESPASGMLRRCVAKVGETLPVGALLAVLADEEIPDAEIDAFVAQFVKDFVPESVAESGAEALKPQTTEIGGRRMRYLKMGEAETTPVILIHGFGGDLNSWLFTQPILAQEHPVYAVDLPGHGGSSKQADSGDLVFLASAVFELMAALKLESAHLVAHSLGGAVAFDLALSRPEQVKSLTLIAPVGFGPEINMEYLEGFMRASRPRQLRPFVERLFANPALVSRKMLDDIISYKRLDGAVEALSTIAGKVFKDGRQAVDLVPRIADLAVPLQIIWGESDRIIPAAHMNGLPASVRVHLIPGAGHMVHMEKAQEVNELIEDFLST
ncbi:MAG: acetoin dehydrogenase dihydrolipoyllysine-residue acetyltransferase subunit [Deltaproteobacteria bacterium]|nr:acetoin dehydrogenase dihydrolipoyllysine-residue acetyltransferase subunit [Deltaproteobacteria bacterium]